MSMSSGSGSGPRSDINVTPLIDVLLVLLIIFMVIQPNVMHGLDTLVPQPPKNPNNSQPDPRTIVVQVLGNGKGAPSYKINDNAFNRTEIEPKLAEIFATRADKIMFVKADADLDFSRVAEIFDFGHQAGVESIGIITPRVKAGQ